MGKAQNSFDSAKREFKAGAYEFAINRLYYSVFYAVSALLMENDMSFKKHTGVRSFFHKEFIKEGLIEFKWGRFYALSTNVVNPRDVIRHRQEII